MDKETILTEIRRLAQEGDGNPPGWRLFESRSSIKKKEWEGVHWARWNDALQEAGLTTNRLTDAYSKSDMLQSYIELARELGRVPTDADGRLRTKKLGKFPTDRTFSKRFGNKRELVAAVLAYCETKAEFADIVEMFQAYVPRKERSAQDYPPVTVGALGYVYLIKSGKFYKIGRTNAVGRREYELGIQLPEKPTKIHEIKTDDPVGIEAYWHKRFESRRLNGEWFNLTPPDIAAFKRWRLIA